MLKSQRLNLITSNIDVNAIKMKEKLDFGKPNGFRRENQPKPILSAEEIAAKKKDKALGE